MTIATPTPIPDAALPLPDASDLATWPNRMAEMHRWMREDAAPGMNTLGLQALQNAEHAEYHAGIAEAMAAYKGPWSGLSGALSRPASTTHADKTWVLLSNLVDVTTAVPGVSPAWAEYADDAYMVVYGTKTVGDELDDLAHLPTAQLAGNKLINPGFTVNQRAVTGTVTLSPGAYGHDRWKAGSSGCTYTFATVNRLTTITITAGTLVQIVEAAGLTNGTHVLSWGGTAQGRIGGSGTYGASGVTASVAGAGNLTIEFGTGTLSRPKLEVGTVPTPYFQRSPAEELALCQRYYETGTMQWSSYTSAATGTHTRVAFRVNKRATPTLSYVPNVATNVSTFDIRDPSVDGARWYCITSAAGMFIWDGSWTASAEL